MKKISLEKIFCFISFLFILSCCIFYGIRFIKLYVQNEKDKIIEKNSLVKVIKENNEDNEKFVNIDDQIYFTNDTNNNYLMYSNLLWRIIKINEDNSIEAISNNSLTSLAYGKNTNYLDSNINRWLNVNDNDDYSGILERQLNNVSTYLQKTITCLDKIETINNNPCESIDNNNYFSLLTTIDFANIGNKNSYIINNENFYLNNTNDKSEIWYVTDDGKITLSKGNDIIGIKPVITIKSNIDYIGGNGTKEDPYTIEKENGLFGSYVKLGNDIWRIYKVEEDIVRLTLNDYIKSNDSDLTYNYSAINSYHDDTIYGGLAYYLNNNYLNSLSYKNLIEENNWPNGYYNDDNNYDYKNSLNKEVNTKVATISIGDIFLNQDLDDYFTMTGTADKGNIIYTIKSNKKIYTKNVKSKSKIIPTICLNKQLLIKGNGTVENPYETE